MALTQVAGGMIASGQTITSPTLTTPNIDSAQIPTVSGTAPLYMCRAWVNFNGTGTVAIRANGNVTSITDNGTGDYTVNFTTAIVDANYSVVTSTGDTTGIGTTSGARALSPMTLTTTTCRVLKTSAAGVALDENLCMVAIIR